MLSKGELLRQEMQAVPVGWSTSAITHFVPARGKERRGAHQALAIALGAQEAAQ